MRDPKGDSIVGAVYEAAFEPQRWPEALRRVGSTVGADSAFFFSTHSDYDPGAVLHVHNQPPEMLREFTSIWHEHDAWALAAQGKGLMRRGALVLGNELIPPRDLHRTAFYNEFCKPYGIDAIVGGVLFDSTEAEPMPFTNLSWYRRGGTEFEIAERERLRAFIPHFQHAMRIQRRIGWVQDQRAQDAFSAMHIASVLLDRLGRVHHHDEAGGRFLASLPPRSYRYGRLHQLGERSAPLIAEALALASGGTPARIAALLPGERPLVIGATLLRVARCAGEPMGVSRGADRFLLLIELPRTNGKQIADAVAGLFQLTPAETRVLVGLLDGVPPVRIARTGGNSLSTVRTHISSLLAKTGTGSQSELLVLLRGLRM